MAAGLVVLALGGCANPNEGDSVAVLGDSITTFDESDMTDRLGDTYELVISGNFGKTAAEVMPEAEFLAARSYDQVIINLGTNDVFTGTEVTSSMDTLSTMVSMFADARCVHLVNINENMVEMKSGTPMTEGARAFNEALDGLAAADERISIIDWAGETADTLNDARPPYSELTFDSVHLTEQGNKRLNSLYARALRRC